MPRSRPYISIAMAGFPDQTSHVSFARDVQCHIATLSCFKPVIRAEVSSRNFLNKVPAPNGEIQKTPNATLQSSYLLNSHSARDTSL